MGGPVERVAAVPSAAGAPGEHSVCDAVLQCGAVAGGADHVVPDATRWALATVLTFVVLSHWGSGGLGFYRFLSSGLLR